MMMWKEGGTKGREDKRVGQVWQVETVGTFCFSKRTDQTMRKLRGMGWEWGLMWLECALLMGRNSFDSNAKVNPRDESAPSTSTIDE